MNKLGVGIYMGLAMLLAGCASNSSTAPYVKGDPAAPTPVFAAISKYERDDKARGPLGGDWQEGIKIFSAANGAVEAQSLVAKGKAVVLLSQGAAAKVIGVPDETQANKIIADRKVRKLGIPETGELVTGADHKKYIEAATKFGQAFNQEMVKRMGPQRF